MENTKRFVEHFTKTHKNQKMLLIDMNKLIGLLLSLQRDSGRKGFEEFPFYHQTLITVFSTPF